MAPPSSTLDNTLSRETSRPQTRASVAARLMVVYPAEVVGEIALGDGKVVIGRKQEGDVTAQVRHGTVSRSHFAVTWDGSAHVGEDLGSYNGSSVGGIDARGARLPLHDGTVVRLGDVLAIYEAGAPPASAPEVARDAVPGDSYAAARLRGALTRAARDPAPALLLGPTGTGKEHLAGELHRLSGRSGRLVPVNCAALARELIESQLFGHVRGAFTGATEAQSGFFRAADGGTLFLDEIGELPLELQPKLLRAIQDGEVVAVGATRGVRCDVRVIAATNQELAAQAETGTFRRDLYARLSLWELRVPALRERRVDVLEWFERLRKRWVGKREAGAVTFDADAAESLLLADWAENLRGIDRLVHELGQDERKVTRAELPAWLGRRADGAVGASAGAAASGPMAVVPGTALGATPVKARASKPPAPSKEELAAVLAQHGGSIRATAKHYARDRRQIYRWLETHGLKGKDDDGEG